MKIEKKKTINKKILKYLFIFVLTLMILFTALTVSSTIPRSAIEEKLKESAEFYKTKFGIEKIKNERKYSYIHYFADTRKLNIIYCIDSEKPIESTLWSNYYLVTKADMNKDFIDLIENSLEPNTQYLRYWNGCMLFLRPLLTIFNMEQIYLLNKILLSVLSLILIIMLLKKSKKLAFIFLLALILVASWYVSFCIEYSVTFYIMLITSMIAIKIDEGKGNANENLFKLFLITGSVTTFFDFLTTELLTIFVPLLLILIIRKEENRLESVNSTFKFVLKASVLWFVGYAGMWVSKWILSSIILHINAFELVKDSAMLRINGLQGLSNHKELYNHVFEKNFFTIPLINFIQINFFKIEIKIGLAIMMVFLLVFTNWKELRNKKYLLVIILICIIPYLRYLILANHSYRHAMFTFRDQIITIMCFMYIVIECLNYKLLLKNVSCSNLLKKSQKNNSRKRKEK